MNHITHKCIRISEHHFLSLTGNRLYIIIQLLRLNGIPIQTWKDYSENKNIQDMNLTNVVLRHIYPKCSLDYVRIDSIKEAIYIAEMGEVNA